MWNPESGWCGYAARDWKLEGWKHKEGTTAQSSLSPPTFTNLVICTPGNVPVQLSSRSDQRGRAKHNSSTTSDQKDTYMLRSYLVTPLLGCLNSLSDVTACRRQNGLPTFMVLPPQCLGVDAWELIVIEATLRWMWYQRQACKHVWSHYSPRLWGWRGCARHACRWPYL